MAAPNDEFREMIREVEEVARRIKYRYLPELVGTRVELDSEESAQRDFIRQLGRYMHPREASDTVIGFGGAYRRYGIMDMSFRAAKGLLGKDARSGMEVLLELCLADTENGEWCPSAINMPGGFQHFMRHFEENQTWFRVFLEDKNSVREQNPEAQGVADRILHRPRFPVSLEITDACAANTSSVWDARHWYW